MNALSQERVRGAQSGFARSNRIIRRPNRESYADNVLVTKTFIGYVAIDPVGMPLSQKNPVDNEFVNTRTE